MKRILMSLAAAGLAASLAACASSEPAVTASAEAAPAEAGKTQSEITIERDLPFATYKGTTLTLDLYLPADPSGAPIAIPPDGLADDLAREGAIAIGGENSVGIPDPPDSDDQGARFLADRGAHIRATAEETACAIRYARSRAAELGSDDPIVAIDGLSQPGGVAAHVALFGATLEESWDEFAAAVGGPPRQVECLVKGGSTRVDALVDTAGTYDLYVPVYDGLYGRNYQRAFDPELQQFLASALGAHPELVVRLFHGTADPAIPVSSSEEFAAALEDAGYDVELTTFEGGHSIPQDLTFQAYKEVLGL